jgi:hypothetical protein
MRHNLRFYVAVAGCTLYTTGMPLGSPLAPSCIRLGLLHHAGGSDGHGDFRCHVLADLLHIICLYLVLRTLQHHGLSAHRCPESRDAGIPRLPVWSGASIRVEAPRMYSDLETVSTRFITARRSTHTTDED